MYLVRMEADAVASAWSTEARTAGRLSPSGGNAQLVRGLFNTVLLHFFISLALSLVLHSHSNTSVRCVIRIGTI